MIAVDTNILVYAHREETPQHERAADALVALAEGDAPWGLPVFVLGELLRVVTHPRIFSPPSSTADAMSMLGSLLASPTAHVLSPGERYWTLLGRALVDGGASGNLVFDAQIVAVCQEHGVDRLLTNDRDFRRFTSVRVETL